MPEIYKFMIDCVGGPFDGTSLTVVNVKKDYDTILLTYDTDTVPEEQQFGQMVYIMTKGGKVGEAFSVPAATKPIPRYETKTGRTAIKLFTYTITDRDVDDDNCVILCTAKCESADVHLLGEAD